MNTFVDFLFPKRCFVCGDVLAGGEHDICLKCLSKDRRTFDAYAKYHEKITSMSVEHIDVCLPYENFRDSITDFKYRFNLYKGRRLALLWAEHLSQQEWIEQIDCILPTPLHWRKLVRRGFNQSEYMGNILSKKLNIPMLNSVVRRQINNPPQASAKNRWSNVRHIFSLKDCKPLEGKHVMVIDDVITTSATTNELLYALKDVKDIKVSAAFLSSPCN